jgi:PIN domain nuclease of toxin-antitoxin system
LFFSSASLWEIAIKYGLNKADFQVDPDILYNGLADNGYQELCITSLHAVAVKNLPPIHKDPFDRILIAQSKTERIQLITCDEKIAQYAGLIEFIQ